MSLDWHHRITNLERAEVVVVGGGPSGVIAAIAAAREGKSTVLIERHGFVGGNMLLPLPILGFLDEQGNQVVQGIPGEIFSRLQLEGLASPHYTCPMHKSYTMVDPDRIRGFLLETLARERVKVFLNTTFVETVGQAGLLEGVVIHSKSGLEYLPGDFFIDCSGDGDLVASAGFDWVDEPVKQPGTLIFRVNHVDIEAFRRCLIDHPEYYSDYPFTPEYYRKNHHFIFDGMDGLVKKAWEDGIPVPVDKVICFTNLVEGEMGINMTRVNNLNGKDRSDLTRAVYETNRQIPIVIEFLRQRIPGFSAAEFAGTAPFIGVRETRKIRGLYTMQQDDVLSGATFPDSVGYASYFVDIHHGDGMGFTFLYPEHPCQIPLRSLIPQEAQNMIIAGRTISASREAFGLLRVMGPCMVMGQAAGAAAAVCLDERKTVQEIKYQQVQEVLRRQQALVG